MHLFKTLIAFTALATSPIVTALNVTEIQDLYWVYHGGQWPNILGGYTGKFNEMQYIAKGFKTPGNVRTEAPKLLSTIELFLQQAASDSSKIRASPKVTSEEASKKIRQRYNWFLGAEVAFFTILKEKKILVNGTEYQANILSRLGALGAFTNQSISDLDTILVPLKGTGPVKEFEKSYNEVVQVYNAAT
ncbi:hypothetical protein TWF481_007337 [Arthrobotrys musiformis]|uniref:Uncharacterized protein n=1 Tax=Arthrobotrys musiformis TaxID=47236 RepID=A0AAV9WCJ2_9PEZI